MNERVLAKRQGLRERRDAPFEFRGGGKQKDEGEAARVLRILFRPLRVRVPPRVVAAFGVLRVLQRLEPRRPEAAAVGADSDGAVAQHGDRLPRGSPQLGEEPRRRPRLAAPLDPRDARAPRGVGGVVEEIGGREERLEGRRGEPRASPPQLRSREQRAEANEGAAAATDASGAHLHRVVIGSSWGVIMMSSGDHEVIVR